MQPTPTRVNQAACEAAAAYVLAKPKGTSDKLEAWLFANQPTLTPDLVKQGAAQTGGITDFDAQYAGAMAQVKEDIGLGAKLKVRSTPTFFINGRKVGGLTRTGVRAGRTSRADRASSCRSRGRDANGFGDSYRRS